MSKWSRDEGGSGSTSTSSKRSMACIQLAIGWYPASGLPCGIGGPTDRARLTFAYARTRVDPFGIAAESPLRIHIPSVPGALRTGATHESLRTRRRDAVDRPPGA